MNSAVEREKGFDFVSNRFRLGVLEDDAGFDTGADGRLTDGREESGREPVPELDAINPEDKLLLVEREMLAAVPPDSDR